MPAIFPGGSSGSEFSSSDESKLDGIEASATADQTGAEIKALYEAVADTNAFTDALLTKLNGIETSATADQTGAQIKSAYEAVADTNAFTDALLTKLNGVEAGATQDQTGAQIKALYEGEADTNAFTDGLATKLLTTQTVLSTVLASDATPVNGTTLTKVMTGPSLEANTKYNMICMIHYTSGTSSDGKIAFDPPTGASGAWHQDLDGDQVPKNFNGTDTITVNGAGGSTTQVAYFMGALFTSSTAGTLDLLVAENVNGSTDFTMKTGTFIVCTELKTA